MPLPVFLFAVLLAFVVVGLGCLLALGVYWSVAGRFVGDLWPKLIGLVIQLLAGVVSLGAAYAIGKDKDEWWPAAVAGVVCIAVWATVKELVDNRVKAVDKLDKAEFQAAERECEARTELLSAFRKAVHEKVRRLMRVIRRRPVKPSPTLLRRALTPDTHLEDLLQNLAVFFAAQLPEDQTPTRNFRVGLYVRQGMAMTPLRAVNHNNPSYNVFSSYHQHEALFRLDTNEQTSHVVRCARQRLTIIVEDCVAASERGEFDFFNADQRGYLRSMVAFYLGEVCCQDGTMTTAALVIDTDAPGFFCEANRDSLEFCLREFGTRIKLELLLDSILAEREKPDEHDG